MRWIWVWVIAPVLLSGAARADVIEPLDGVVAVAVTDPAQQPLAHAPVRLVSDAVVVIGRTDARGTLVVRGLRPGRYRIEVERGTVRPFDPTAHLTLDPEPYGRCVLPLLPRTTANARCWDEPDRGCQIWRAQRQRTFAATGPRGHVETTSTTQRILLGPRQLLGR